MAAKKSYAEKLKDPRWQKKRLEVLSAADWLCQCCGEGERTLHVHHKFYRKGAEPWEYATHELETLCEDCHEYMHSLKEPLNEAIGLLAPHNMEVVIGFARALHARDEGHESVLAESGEQLRGIAYVFNLTEPEVFDLMGVGGWIKVADLEKVRRNA